jgi:5'-methylthioadenosine phosphorylase
MTVGATPVLGVVGGSGIYELDGLADVRRVAVATPWGEPSDEIVTGTLGAVRVAFLPRHGRGHRLGPGEVNYRANIDALKRLGVTDLISLSACGSLREGLAPGTFVVVDQFIDRTFARAKSFFGQGIVAHVSMAHPVCARLGAVVAAAAAGAAIPCIRGGTYLAIEGPQFSTLGESRLYRAWGCDVIGMTNMPEAKLAREAEICYATVAMVTDFDVWHPDHDHVQVADVLRVLAANADHARALIGRAAPGLGDRPVPCPHGCDRSLDAAVVTPRAAWPAPAAERLSAILARLAGQEGAP